MVEEEEGIKCSDRKKSKFMIPEAREYGNQSQVTRSLWLEYSFENKYGKIWLQCYMRYKLRPYNPKVFCPMLQMSNTEQLGYAFQSRDPIQSAKFSRRQLFLSDFVRLHVLSA
jgi:hypothetical protein